MQLTKESVLELVKEVGTGGMPETKKLGSEIYGEFYIEPLAGIKSVRRTKERFKQFDIFNYISNGTVLDVGCHIGSLCFHALELGAKHVTGVDTNVDRVFCANQIKQYCGERKLINENDISFVHSMPDTSFDVVLCCSVDDYVLDKDKFYGELIEKAENVLILESNVQIYDNHPFSDFCHRKGYGYQWLGEVVDKYPYGKNRVRNLFKVEL